MTDPNCIFCKIVRGEIPAKKIYDDAEVIAFHDIRPQAPVHLLIVPKTHIATLYDATAAHQAALGKMLAVAGRLAREITDACLQYYGGMGFMNETPISRAYRDSRLASIGGGADEVMLGIISKYMGILPGRKK